MEWQQFYNKNKKIIVLSLISLVLIIGLGICYCCLCNKPEVKNENSNNNNTTASTIENSQYVKTAISNDLDTFLNPFSIHTKTQREMMTLLKTNFIDIVPNWSLAQSEGLSTNINDFSRIINNHVYTPGKLKPCYQLGLLKSYPKYYDNTLQNDINDLSLYITSENSFKPEYNDHENRARNIKSKVFLLQLRDDLQFEDSTKINAETIKYTLEEYKKNIDKFKNEENPELTSFFLNLNNIQLLEQVQFEPKDEHSFILKYENQITLYDLFVNLKSLILLPQEKYKKANFEVKDAESIVNKYGKTPDHPFLSYGVYKLIQGYNNDYHQEYIFEKNNQHFKAFRYPLQKIIYKIIPDNQEFKENLFKKSLINEIDLDSDSRFLTDNPKYQNQYIQFLTNINDLFLFFENREECVKTNFFINDKRFRSACFLALDRNKMSSDVSFLYLPKLSFVCSIALVTDDIPYIETQTHKKNLTDFLSIPQPDSLINTGGYNPSLAKTLFNEVWEEYKRLNNNDESKIKLLFPFSNNQSLKNIMNNIKTQLENCFGNDKIEIIFSESEYSNFNLDISDAEYLGQNAINTLGYVFDITKVNFQSRELVFKFENETLNYLRNKYSANTKWQEYFFNRLNPNNEWKTQIEDWATFLRETLLIEPHITDKEKIFFLDLLFQVEKDNYEKMPIIPLLQKTKIKIYQNLQTDFNNMFLLEHFC